MFPRRPLHQPSNSSAVRSLTILKKIFKELIRKFEYMDGYETVIRDELTHRGIVKFKNQLSHYKNKTYSIAIYKK